MMQYPEGATPLSEDELQGLIPGHIVTRGDGHLLWYSLASLGCQ